MKCKQCGTRLKLGLDFCPSCGMKIGTIKDRALLLLTSILKNCHVGICLLASLILFISFVIQHNTIATTIMLYDIPVLGMSLYYCLGLNLLWYVAMLIYLRKITIPTIIELLVLSFISGAIIIFNVFIDLDDVYNPILILLDHIADSFFTTSIVILLAIGVSILSLITYGIMKKKKGDIENANQ